MFKKSINLKKIIIVLSCIIFILFIYNTVKVAKNKCLGIPFITEEKIQQIAYFPLEHGNIVCLEDDLVPYDIEERTVYLTCNVEENTKFHELKGRLSCVLPGYQLYFLWQDAFNNLKDSIMRGHVFMIFAIDDVGNFTSFYVNFTTLPVVEMNGEVIAIDEQEREIYSGELTVWDPNYRNTRKLSVQNSRLEWHVRGFSSMSALKKSLKLNLKESNGTNNNLAFLGFESDDDYILNPMWFDDIKVREKLAMDLWNQMADEKSSVLKMSGGEYCELIINGNYEGLRVLQNKIERSYLKLDSEDILLKGKNINLGTVKPPEEVYEVIYSNQDVDTTFATISDFFYMEDFSNVNIESWVDLQLFLHLGNMVDNEVYKNIYYVIEREDGEESLSFIPWDTDMSFGVYWEDGFRLLPESVEEISYRLEYEKLKEHYPQLDEMLAKRWKELRDTVFSEENIYNKLDECYTILDQSGVINRDFNVLGWYSWGHEDTREGLYNYIQRRLHILDEKYQINE